MSKKDFKLALSFVIAVHLVSGSAFAYKLGDLGIPANYTQKLRKSLDGAPSVPAATMPGSFNFFAKGLVTPAKDQGSCGSCWAFAATGALESKMLLKSWESSDFSEQKQISCNTAMSGRQGGSMSSIQFWESNQPMLESCTKYPSSNASVPSCATLNSCVITGWPTAEPMSYYTVNTANVQDIKSSLWIDGPSYFRYDCYDDFQTWWSTAAAGSVYKKAASGGSSGGHAVLIVGWDDTKQAWLCKNSWGQFAGPEKNGTFWIAYSGHAVNLNFGMANNIVKGGNLWATAVSSNYIYKLARNNSWMVVQGLAKKITGDPRMLALQVSDRNIVWKLTRNRGWVQIEATPTIYPTDITQAWNSQTGRHDVFTLNSNGDIYKLNSSENGWTNWQGIGRAIDCGYDGSVWHVGLNDGYPWVLDPTRGWVKMYLNLTTQAADIAVDDAKTVYCVTTNGNLYQLNAARTGWTKISCGFAAKQVDVDLEFVYALSTGGTVYRSARGTTAWISMPGINASSIGCSSYR